MEDLEKLLNSLSWYLPEEEQEIAIEELVKYKHYYLNSLITKTGKHQWFNAIRLIRKLNYSDQLELIPQMLFLLKDLNWPGANEAVELMIQMNKNELKPHIIIALEEADSDNDTIWIAWIKDFIERINLTDLEAKHIEILNKAEW